MPREAENVFVNEASVRSFVGVGNAARIDVERKEAYEDERRLQS